MPYQHVGGILVFSNKHMSNNNIQLPKRGFPGDYIIHINTWLAVWLSGNTFASINIVALRQTRLVHGWVTVCGRVNHLRT